MKEKEMEKLIDGYAELKEVVTCRRCGEVLTSPRSIRLGIGQRCKWAEDEENGTRVRRNSTTNAHLKDNVPWHISGDWRKGVYQMKLTDFEEYRKEFE